MWNGRRKEKIFKKVENDPKKYSAHDEIFNK
jgi:ribosomal protein S17